MKIINKNNDTTTLCVNVLGLTINWNDEIIGTCLETHNFPCNKIKERVYEERLYLLHYYLLWMTLLSRVFMLDLAG